MEDLGLSFSQIPLYFSYEDHFMSDETWRDLVFCKEAGGLPYVDPSGAHSRLR